MIHDNWVELLGTVIGKRIAELAAKWNKKVSLEMGGKNACIVYPSANLQRDLPIIARF